MVLPSNGCFPTVPPEVIGTGAASANFSHLAMLQVYALNKARAPEGKDAVKWAYLRYQAVIVGWYRGQAEVKFVEPVVDAAQTMFADVAAFAGKEQVMVHARKLAGLIPLCADSVDGLRLPLQLAL